MPEKVECLNCGECLDGWTVVEVNKEDVAVQTECSDCGRISAIKTSHSQTDMSLEPEHHMKLRKDK